MEALLRKISELIHEHNSAVDSTGERFNIFQITGVNHYEAIHSAILAEFLNPRGTHGSGNIFLEKFIKCIHLDFEFDINNAIVVTEYVTTHGRIDILIESEKKAIIIENKICANDQPEQLKRYNEFAIEKYQKNYSIVYLTLHGELASEDSGKNIIYKPISYVSDIISWLNDCMFGYNSRVQETIKQYITHIKYLTNETMDTKIQDELVNMIIKEPNNIESVFKIVDNFNSIRKKIIDNLNITIYKLSEQENLVFEPINKNGIDAFFFFSKETLPNYKIKFYFKKNHFINFSIDIEGDIKDLKFEDFSCKYKDWNSSIFQEIVSENHTLADLIVSHAKTIFKQLEMQANNIQ
ncbi:MAG: Endonuclease NucS [Bacteroidetes bacterium ADurb.Bin217]|nr:MAG: Endonuclease NucS [Bacteroidetes bacterium ADurb.Bin217]